MGLNGVKLKKNNCFLESDMLSYQMIMGVLGHLRSLTVGGGCSGNRKNNRTDRIYYIKYYHDSYRINAGR